jgi:mono/diheme cytochrome c family protein
MPRSPGTSAAALLFAASALTGTAILWQPHGVCAEISPAPNTVAYYNQRVLPILQANCYSCHGGLNHRGGLNISTKAGLLKGGHDGSVLDANHPEQSLLIKLIRHEGPPDDPMPMPPRPRAKISDADIATITEWVKAGAVMPE